MWFSPTRSIDYKSKKDGIVSLVHTAVRNAPNFDARLPRQIWTFLLSSIFTSTDAKDSQISVILRV
jgi:hypothetical protein